MCNIIQQQFSSQYHLFSPHRNKEVKSKAAEAIGSTVIRVRTQTHKIILYTAIILTFGQLPGLCRLRRFGFLYDEQEYGDI